MQTLEAQAEKRRMLTIKHQEHLAAQEIKWEEAARTIQEEQDEFIRYKAKDVTATKCIRERNEATQKRIADQDRIEGQRSFNQHKKETAATAQSESISESRAWAFQKKKADSEQQAKHVKHLAMEERIEGQHAFNILHKMAEEGATRSAIEENRIKSETLQLVRQSDM